MKKQRKDKHFIKKPIYKGGLKALRSFIKKHLQYPETASSNQIEGTVLVKYTINYKGEVILAKVLKGIGYGCDKEAIRLVKLLQFKIPKTRKVKIQFHKSIQIHFKLPTTKKTSGLNYNYTQSTPLKEESGKSSYTYTIKLP